MRSIGYVNVAVHMGNLNSHARFHVINARTSYQLLIGRVWMHAHGMIPSTFHQCAKANIKGVEVTVGASERPFSKEEAHLVDAVFYTEQREEVPFVPMQIIGIPLPKWEPREGRREKGNEGKRKENPPARPRKTKRVTMPDGTITYHL